MSQQKNNQQNKQKKRPRFFNRRKKQQPKPKGNFAFIDAQNLNLGIQRAGFKLNWKEFRQYMKNKHNVEQAFLFVGYVPDNESLYNQMDESGYTVVLKPTVDMLMTKEELDKEEHVTKGNVDTVVVLYMIKEMQNYNKAVLVSGDGDFYSVIEYLKQQDKLEKVLVPNMRYSSLLKHFEDDIERLDLHRSELEYRDYRKKRTSSKRSNTRNKQKSKTSK